MLHKIYPLCDFGLLQKYDVSLLQYLEILQNFDVKYIQYRDKINSIDIQKQNLQILKSNTDIPIIINDKLELLEYADGLHLGQEDLAFLVESKSLTVNFENKLLILKLLKKKFPSKLFGLSTHNEKEILEANKLPLDYIGLGAYRTTSTKDVSNKLGEYISYLGKISKHPVGAIGGVKVDDKIENIDYLVVGSNLLLLQK